jgi:hypothetical protein
MTASEADTVKWAPPFFFFVETEGQPDSKKNLKFLNWNKEVTLELYPPEVCAMEFFKENEVNRVPQKRNDTVTREKIWLEKQLSRDNVKENKWPTLTDSNKPLKVVPIKSGNFCASFFFFVFFFFFFFFFFENFILVWSLTASC